MRLLPLSNLNFRRKIIDYHTHTGPFMDKNFKKDELDKFMSKKLPCGDEVTLMVVSDMKAFNCGADEFLANRAILNKICTDNRYALMLSCSPNNGSAEKLRHFIERYPNTAKGLKFHPNAQNLPVGRPEYEPYFEFAQEYNLPCLFHSVVPTDETGKLIRDGNGRIDKKALDKWSDPELIYEAAKKYPQVPFIIAHMGSGWREAHDRTIDILIKATQRGDANMYADISWVDIDSELANGHRPKPHITKAIKRLKGINDPSWDKGDQSFRLIFGTDAPIGRFGYKNGIRDYSDFVSEIQYAIKHDSDLAADSEQIIDDIFYNNAKRLIDRAEA